MNIGQIISFFFLEILQNEHALVNKKANAYLASKARAKMPAASGAAADVPE